MDYYKFKTDIYLGRAIINLSEAANSVGPNFFTERLDTTQADSIPKPKWYPIRFGND